MHNVTLDLGAAGVASLFAILSFFLGVALAVAGALLGFFGAFIFAFVEIVAGSRSSDQASNGGFIGVAIRSLIYIGVCFTAIILAATGHAAIANILAVAGGISLGIAFVKLVSRLS